jgi:ribosome biogenesis GTPase
MGELPHADPVAIEEVLPRANELVRTGPGGRRAKIVAANLDRCVVVLAASEPDVDLEQVDRFLVLAESCRIPPVLVLNKLDLPPAPHSFEEVLRTYRPIGYPVMGTSAKTGEGTDELRALLGTGISALVGPSGVGKSSLLNHISPGWDLRTGALSVRSGRGRQTTVSSRLIPLEGGGWAADTPGFSDVGLWGVGAAGLDAAFPEMRVASRACRFRGCSHLTEPDCGVKAALAAGEIESSRYASYRTIRGELAGGSERPSGRR